MPKPCSRPTRFRTQDTGHERAYDMRSPHGDSQFYSRIHALPKGEQHPITQSRPGVSDGDLEMGAPTISSLRSAPSVFWAPPLPLPGLEQKCYGWGRREMNLEKRLEGDILRQAFRKFITREQQKDGPELLGGSAKRYIGMTHTLELPAQNPSLLLL